MNFLKIIIGMLLLVITACTSIEQVPLPTETREQLNLATIDAEYTQTQAIIDVEDTQTQAATQAAIDTERTAIARFTENLTLALSSTPFYGIILYNEVVRQHTQTPTLDPIQPTPECWLVADYWQLRDFVTNIKETLSQNGIEAHVESFVSVVWNVETCGEYLPVSNTIRIWIDSSTILGSADAGHLAASIIETVNSLIADVEDISQDSSSILLQISFRQEKNQLSVLTTWDVVLNNLDLSGDELITALGGLKE